MERIGTSLEGGADVKSIGPNEFERMLGIMDAATLDMVLKSDLRYRGVSESELESILIRYIDTLLTPKTPSGKGYQAIWEQGWNENLKEFKASGSLESLLPKFVRRGEYVRYEGEWIAPISNDFESTFVRILRADYFKKYFSSVDILIEIGSGTGLNAVHFLEIFPKKIAAGLDWSDSAVEILNMIGKKQKWPLSGIKFDMFQPTPLDKLISNKEMRVGLLSIGALEQLGMNYQAILDWCLSARQTEVVCHMETNFELYDTSSLFGFLPMKYIEKRNWLRGYFRELNERSKLGTVQILEQTKTFGSFFHDGYAVTVWKGHFER